MEITFLGTGSAMPTGERFQTGIVVAEGDHQLLVDCGSGVLHRLEQAGVGYRNISTVLLTHHHLDHVADLLPLLKARWLAGESELTVVGPVGTRALLSDLLDIFDYLQGRVDLTVEEVEPGQFELAGFEISAHETVHSVPTLAYRFGDEFTFSADTEADVGVADFADGSAILAHDCSFPDDVDVSNHPTPSQLGTVLAGTDIGRVYLTHFYPHTQGRKSEMLDSIQKHYDGDVRFADDLRTVTVKKQP